MNNPIKIIIADDHQLFCDGMEQILASVEDYIVIAKVSNGKLLIQLMNNVRADLILLDINMPYMDGLASSLELRKRYPDIKIIFVSMYYNAKLISFAKEHKINGFMLKDVTALELRNTVAEILKGNFIYPSIKNKEQVTPLSNNDHFIQKYNLSARELEIIKLIKTGNTTRQIAETLYLSAFTIETHRKNIFKKLEIKNMAMLVDFANNHII